MNWIICAIVGLLSGVLGSMGMGGGGILIIYFSIFTQIPQATAQGINLIFFIPIGILSLIIYQRKKLINWKILIPFAILGILGSVAGTWLSSLIDNSLLSKLFGGLLVIMGIRELFTKYKGKENKKQ